MTSAGVAPYFLCLCSAERQPLLAQACAPSSQHVVFVDRIDDLLIQALQAPPLGLILDIATSIRFGAERMSRFLNLGVNWPVMRCALNNEGEARVMCFEPPQSELLLTALDAIAAGDPAWIHPRFHRQHLRLNIKGRIKMRTLHDDRWRLGCLLGVSCGGCFAVMTSDAPLRGEEVEVEMVDFAPGPQRAYGKVAWTRDWQDSLEMPGVGIEFKTDSIAPAFRDFILKSPQLNDLIAEE